MTRTLFAIVFFVANTFATHAELPGNFATAKANYLRHPILKEFTPQELELLDPSSFMMIDGIFADLGDDQFKPWEKFLKSKLPNSDFKSIRPSSFQGIEENADYLTKEIVNSSHEKKKILIAHSRGAAELFIALLKDPSIFERANISKIIFIQGAFSGTPIADVIDESLVQKCQMKDKNKLLENICDLVNLFSATSSSLSTTESLRLRASLQKNLNQDARKLFQERVYFVRSESTLKDCPLPFKASAFYLNHFYSSFKNDCLLFTTHQRVPNLGTDLGVLKADHLSLIKGPKGEEKLGLVFLIELLRSTL